MSVITFVNSIEENTGKSKSIRENRYYGRFEVFYCSSKT